MRTSSILTLLLAISVNARVIPSFLSTTPKPGVVAREADESVTIRSRSVESTVIRGIKETMMPGRVRIDDIVEIELVR